MNRLTKPDDCLPTRRIVAVQYKKTEPTHTADVVIPIYFDYASSLCYVASEVVRGLDDELGATFLWKGVQIARLHRGWKNGHAIDERARANVLRVADETGVALRVPERWLDSAAALEGAEFARERGRFAEYHRAVFAAAYEGGCDLARPDVLGDAAERAGLAGAELRRHLEAGTFAARVKANEAESRAFGVSGYPTFMLGAFPLVGIQTRDTMRLLLGRYVEQARKRPVH